MTAPTAPTEQEISEAIEAAYTSNATTKPVLSLDQAVNDWVFNLTDADAAIWERWPCGDEECPARPPWDIRLSEVYGETVREAREQAADAIRAVISAALVKFAAEHPDAPRPSTKPLVSAGV